MKKIFSILCGLVLCVSSLFCFSACDNSAKQTNIVASNFATYDFAKAISEEHLTVSTLLKPGTESHHYEPSVSDINRVVNCDIFIYIGGENEQWIETILENIDPNKTTVVKMFDFVEPIAEIGHDEYDEHIWTSPKNAVKMVNAIKNAIINFDTKNQTSYEQNANDYIAELNQIDVELNSIVEQQNKPLMIADRNPYRYLLTDYSFEYTALINNCSGEVEPSLSDLALFIQKVTNESVNIVFTVELSTQNYAKRVKEECENVEIKTLHSCHNVSLTETESGATYVSIMKNNVTNLREALV